MKILLYADLKETSMGAMMVSGCHTLGWEYEVVDIRKSRSRWRWLNSLYWHFLDRGRPGLGRVSSELIRKNRTFQPDLILFSGIPIFKPSVLRRLRLESSAKLCVYMTDDPWNPGHFTRRFFRAIGSYDHIFSTKSAIIEDLEKMGATAVSFLPFAYDPARHYPEEPTEDERNQYGCDVAYVGGGDRDRISDFQLLLQDPALSLKLYGGYWGTFPETQKFNGGVLDSHHYRIAVASAKVNIINGRRANRDQHAMRSFEIPAMGGCCVVEDSPEHREIFGKDGECCLYYANPQMLYDKVKYLLDNVDLRKQLANNAYHRFTTHPYSYADALKKIAEECNRAEISISPKRAFAAPAIPQEYKTSVAQRSGKRYWCGAIVRLKNTFYIFDAQDDTKNREP